MQLRDYQQAGVDQIRAAFSAGARAVCYQLPTGGGKTPIFCYVCRGAVALQNRVCVLVHRRELLRQADRHLTDWGVEHGVIAPNYPRTGHLVQVASVQTLVRRTGHDFDLLVFDEGHHAVAQTWRRIMHQHSTARVLGVTATPSRLSGRGLGTVYDTLICGPTTRELIDAGHLSEYRYYRAQVELDLTGLRSRGGDYDQGQLADLMDRRAITGNAVAEYARHCNGYPAMVFTVSVAHAQAVCEQFRAEGWRAVAVEGKMPQDARDAAFGGLASGRYNVLVACELASEGVDVPAVSAAIMLRPTKSPTVYLQQVGRALRPHPGKQRAVILDHVGNYLRHGLPDSPRTWSLNAGHERETDGEAAPRIRQCEVCFCCHDWAPTCPECGYEYPPAPRPDPKQEDGKLEELTPDEIRALHEHAKHTGKLKDYHAWARASGRKPGAAWYAWKKRRAGARRASA